MSHMVPFAVRLFSIFLWIRRGQRVEAEHIRTSAEGGGLLGMFLVRDPRGGDMSPRVVPRRKRP